MVFLSLASMTQIVYTDPISHMISFLLTSPVQLEMRRVILRGPCVRGPYPLKSFKNKQVMGPSSPPLYFVSEPNRSTVCDACQQGKNHQLSYPRSFSRSIRTLDPMFSGVGSPAPTSVGKFSYYVSFIDDFSKLTWIYLLRHKSEAFKRFHDFQNLVERLFNRNSFFQ